MTARIFEAGGFRYAPGVFQYSAGVAATPGYEIVRVRFREPAPLAEGFARAEAIVAEAGRPMTAFCACELRSPAPFTEEGFRSFNQIYVGALERWGLYRDGENPVARSNVCPEIHKPAEPSLHAFCYTVESTSDAPSFIVAGGAEAPEGKGDYRDHIVRLGDVSPPALVEKARFVLTEMERRMGVLGVRWKDVTATQAYTVHDLHPFLADEIVRRGAARHGLTWHYDRPPVVDLEFEMDCRGVAQERVV